MTRVFTLAVTLGCCVQLAAEVPDEVVRGIREAGNAGSEEQRLTCLRRLQQLPGLDAGLRADLEKLVGEIEPFAAGKRLDAFGKKLKQKMDYDFGLSPSSPLEPLTWLYRGRMITWQVLESGGLWNDRNQKRELLDKARGFFEQTAKAFPENPTAPMYLGKSQPALKQYAAPAGAPAWAVHQREALERLTDIVEWWIDHRMQPDGQYGGGWGDDCEMWRWWVPVLIGFDEPKLVTAQARFSAALLSQPHMQKGYSSILTDVEHSAEDSADAMTPMMHLDPDNPVWRSRALRLAELMESLWTGRNERGLLQFKSTYFASERVDSKSQRACDTVYHPRAVQPALLFWQRTGDPKLTSLFRAWMDTWVDATARAERGKPAGVIPTAIHWPDGGIGGLGPDWWDPRNHGEATLYQFPSAMGQMLHTLLLTWHMTGDEKYLAPIRSMAALRLKYLRNELKGSAGPGSEAWCAAKIDVASVLAKHKFLTGSSEFDPLLERERPPGLAAISGNRDALERALGQTAAALAINFDGFTREVRFTDRVLRFPTLFTENGMFEQALPGFRSPDPSLLYSTVSGDPGDALYFPLNAVRWLTPPRDIAALVTATGKERFGAELFHFGTSSRKLSAELFLLAAGNYTWELAGAGVDLQRGRLEVKGSRSRIAFELAPQKACKLAVRKASGS